MSSSTTGRGRSREVTILAALLAVAVAIIGMLLMRPSGQPAAAPTAATTSQGAGQPGAAPTTQGKVKDTARRKEGDPLAIGKIDAPVTMIEYADYACPFCAKWALQTQPALIKKYVDAGVLRIEWHDLVIFGDKSRRAAMAARAAGEQGKFWEYQHALFAASPTSGHPDLTDDKLLAFAKQAGVTDLARFTKDMESSKIDEAIGTETATAQQLGANSTPVFIINGTPLVGAQPEEAFVQVIERAKAARG
ncbi:DsbA family protein [Arsenicicoccus dermatophilus]|uniref:DsbA family protein n=1 Tax=Arsenicicoccus dermatophilus TaxID=1076331 RepID=UPI001F4D12D3|nr:thioredoxin domain-containing protein [Arsenicicoccus dermatophilus]MCH8611734.1 DsbA family protein [Arsenicicoccus dermatophilus]